MSCDGHGPGHRLPPGSLARLRAGEIVPCEECGAAIRSGIGHYRTRADALEADEAAAASSSRVVIPTPELDCPARRALRMEGLEAGEVLCAEPFHYGHAFASFWDAGEPFVIVEWDIIPFPGAVTALLECPEPWCTHRYPLNRGRLSRSFGIGKYAPRGAAPAHWRQTPWDQLDGQVVPVLLERLGRPHVHEPPVAHARREAV